MNNNIIDCGKSIDISEEIFVIIPDSENNCENNIITQQHVEYVFNASNTLKNKKKLNYNYKTTKPINDNEYRTRKNKSNSRSNTPDISTRNNKYYNRNKQCEQIISHNRMFAAEKANQYQKLFNQSGANNDQRNMHNLSKTSRLYEFKTRKRKVLLDSQPKPKSLS